MHRRMIKNIHLSHGSGSEIGSFLGWAMAIIYMCGRLPQIFLNMSHRKQLKTFPVLTFFYGKYIFGTTLSGWLCHIVAYSSVLLWDDGWKMSM